jgi:hypothetical protein
MSSVQARPVPIQSNVADWLQEVEEKVHERAPNLFNGSPSVQLLWIPQDDSELTVCMTWEDMRIWTSS